jgi:hypothetical protein
VNLIKNRLNHVTKFRLCGHERTRSVLGHNCNSGRVLGADGNTHVILANNEHSFSHSRISLANGDDDVSATSTDDDDRRNENEQSK